MVGSIALIVIAVFLFIIMNFSQIAKKAIEHFGSEIVGVPVTVGFVMISPLSGKGEIRGLTIGNPEGYKESYLLKIKSLSMSLDTASLLGDPIHIKHIKITKPDINWEGNFKRSNLTEVNRNVDAFNRKLASTYGLDSTESKNVFIRTLKIQDAVAHVQFKGLGLGKTKVKVADIEMNNIGTAEKGVSFSQVSQKIFSKLGSSITASIQASPEFAGKAVKGVVDEVEKGGKILKDVKGLFGK